MKLQAVDVNGNWLLPLNSMLRVEIHDVKSFVVRKEGDVLIIEQSEEDECEACKIDYDD